MYTDSMKPTGIGDLPNEVLHRILENIPIQNAATTSIISKRWVKIWSTQPHLEFDIHFFQYVSKKGASPASIIHKILMQHTGPILGFHINSKTVHKLPQSDVDQCIIFVSNHGIKKLTLVMANNEKYVLPNRIFTCGTLTHLKLSRCIFKLPDGTQFPNLVCLELERSEVFSRQGSEDTLSLPMLETLKLRLCTGVDRVTMVSPKIENFFLLSSYKVTFFCFDVNQIFTRIKHLCLNGTSLEKLGSIRVPKKLQRSLNLQSLKICDFKLSVQSVSCAFCLLRSSPILYELDLDGVVKVDETLSQKVELLSYLIIEQDHVNEALRMIRTVRLRKFKGTNTEMYLIRVLISHSRLLERMIIEQCEEGYATSFKEDLRELLSCIRRASPKAVAVKYLQPVLPRFRMHISRWLCTVFLYKLRR